MLLKEAKMLPRGVAKTGHKLEKIKMCNCCGSMHKFIPFKAPFKSDLFWWDCNCGSTMVAYEDMIKSRKGETEI